MCLKPGKASGPDNPDNIQQGAVSYWRCIFRLLYATGLNKYFGMQIPKPEETGTSEMSSQEREHSRLRNLRADFSSQHSEQAVRECC